jgi:hypothetical protein
MATCGFNMNDALMAAPSWKEFYKSMDEDLQWLHKGQSCKFEEPVNE